MTDTVLAEFSPPSPFEPPEWVARELERPTGKGLTVAVVDSGWDRTCNDPRVLPGVGLVDPNDDLALQENDDDHDLVGHGTACIHQILRIAPDARVIPIKVFGRSLETSPHTLQTAIRIAIEKGVDVVNLSLGTRLEGTLNMLYAGCEKARRLGMIIVAAGDNSRQRSFPAIFENVIGVSAAKFESAYHYRYLPNEAHECQAWGVEQPVVWLGGEEQVKHGTSFAAPNITGIVCLLLERHPGASLEQIRELLAQYALETIHTEEEDDDDVELAFASMSRPPKPAAPAAKTAKAPARKPTAAKSAAAKSAAKKPAATKPAAADQSAAPKSGAGKSPAAKPAAAKSATKKPAAKPRTAEVSDSKPGKTPARKPAAQKSAAKKAPVAKTSKVATSAEKPAAKKASPRRRPAGATKS